jgi:hypothetical protein
MQHLATNTDSYRQKGKPAILFLFTMFLFVSVLAPVLSAPPADAATTEMAHTQPDYFVPDHRIRLEAQVEDSEGVKLVRCYFKAAGEADLVFVPMRAIGSDKYIGVLPAPSGTTDQIEYLFLSVNNAKKVVRTQTFTMTKDVNQAPPAWQESAKGEIKVSMELDKVPTELRGFSDNVTIDAVESGARFGVVALLYHNISTTTVSSSTTATGATSGGTITAGTAGWSTAAIVGVGVGAAAVVGGIAAASGGGGGSGGSDAEELTETTILGDWNFRGNRRDGVLRTGNITFNDNGTHIYSVKDDGQSDADNADGTWFLSGTDLTITFQTMSTWVGAVSGDSRKFTLDTSSGSNHGTYRFTR